MNEEDLQDFKSFKDEEQFDLYHLLFSMPSNVVSIDFVHYPIILLNFS